MIPIQYSLRSLAARKTTTLSTALGIALVVFVFSGVLMLGAGIRQTLSTTGHDDVVLLLRDGSDTEITSLIDLNQVPLVLSSREVKRRSDGTPDGVGEAVTVLDLERSDGQGLASVQVRGVTDEVLVFRPELRIVEGRMARPGSDECVLGRAIRGRFRGLELGQTLELSEQRALRIVGIMSSEGSSFESEIWADLHVVRAAFAREGSVQSIRVRLSNAGLFKSFQDAVVEKRLGLKLERESEYYERQSEGSSGFIVGMGIAIALLFTLGAIMGAMITMYAAVASRKREIGVLRALGFRPLSIVMSFLLEAILLALFGGSVGALASLGLGLVTFSVVSASWQEVVFQLQPTMGGLLGSLGLALVVGTLGGSLPAIRAARLPVIRALREG